MKSLASVLLTAALLASCSNADLEDRVKKLEATNKKYADALEYLQQAMNQNKQAKAQQEREEPAPDAVFAVDVTPDVKGGQVEGSNAACVTIVEAWDFA
jgi:hypothetical protein